MKPLGKIIAGLALAALLTGLSWWLFFDQTAEGPVASALTPSAKTAVKPAPDTQVAQKVAVEMPKLAPAVSSPDAPHNTAALNTAKDDPSLDAMRAQQLAMRESQRQKYELTMQQMQDQFSNQLAQATTDQQREAAQRQLDSLQTTMQQQLEQLSQPPPPPTDLGEIEFADGVPMQVTLASGDNATLTPTVQADGSLRLNVMIQNSTGLGWGSTVSIKPGQSNTFMMNDNFLKITPKLKDSTSTAQNPTPSSP